MEHAEHIEQVKIQSAALRTAALAAGPEAHVPTCPKWTVHDLVDHIARVHAWAGLAARTAPDGDRPARPTAPEGWDDLLTWWDDRLVELFDVLSDAPDTPAWSFVGPDTVRFWSRRQAHETAIHRLDAEHALHGPEVPSLLFGAEFAADGIDEFLTIALVRAAQLKPVEKSGSVLLHAADAGRAWELRLTAGGVPQAGPVTDSGIDEDATIAGTADAVYRAVWRRPSGAIITGDLELVRALPPL